MTSNDLKSPLNDLPYLIVPLAPKMSSNMAFMTSNVTSNFNVMQNRIEKKKLSKSPEMSLEKRPLEAKRIEISSKFQN